MMSKYKIKEYGRAFKVWELRDMGNGDGCDDVKLTFQTEEQAKKYKRCSA